MYVPKRILIAGTLVSGKDKISQILKNEFGYEDFYFGKTVMQRAEELGLANDRESLQKLGHNERIEHGVYAWVNRILENAGRYEKFSVNGLRYKEDVIGLRDCLTYTPLIWVDSPEIERFRRMSEKRKRDGDPLIWEEFQAADKKDKGISDGGQRTSEVEALADYRIWNVGPEEEFLIMVYNILADFGLRRKC